LVVANALMKALTDAGHRVMVVAVATTHAHAVVELPIDLRAYNRALGKAKCDASRAIRKAIPGRVWARRDKHRMLRSFDARSVAYKYVRDDQGPSAAVWCADPKYTREALID
jgi:mRNA-degrading endonuclease toxin of MazEF toxin-antitoxin module